MGCGKKTAVIPILSKEVISLLNLSFCKEIINTLIYIYSLRNEKK